MQGPDQSADFDSRAIGQRHGSARRTQPDPQNTGRIVGEFTDAIEGTNDRVKQADRHRSKFIRSVSRDTAKRSYNPAFRRSSFSRHGGPPKKAHRADLSQRPAHCDALHSSHYAARMSPQPPPARFGSPRIGPNSRVPRSIFASMLRRNDV